MSESIEYEIDNVGGIEHAKLTLRPGVAVLRGRNGAGKTSAFKAISRAQGAEVEIERRDGSDHGTVRGGGVLLRVGKVVRTSGEAELGLADTSPLSALIDPGLKDSDAAARARLRALVEMLGLAVDDAAVAKLAGGDEEVARWLTQTIQEEAISDLMVAAERARSRFHALARAREEAADLAKARHDTAASRSIELLDALGGSDRVTLSVEAAREAVAEGGRQHERALAQCEAREALETRQAALRETIGERPDPAQHVELADECAGKVALADQQIAKIEDQIRELEQARATIREDRSRLAAERDGHLDAAADAGARAERWDQAQAVLAQKVEGPTRDELAGIEARLVKRAIAQLELAETARDHRAALAEAADATESHSIAMRDANRLRALATEIPARLGEILAAAGAPGLTVISGRVHALSESGPLDFERRLSDGQRVRIALDVAAHVFGEGSVVPLDGDYWSRLDPDARARFAKLAREHQLVVLTEEPAEGELRVENV